MKYYFSIAMTTQEFMPYYHGRVQAIVVTSTLGKRVQFPAMHLRKFLSASGIYGYFCLETENNKFKSLQKLAD